MSSSKKGMAVSEDWTVVILGFAIIFLAIAGIKLAEPSFNWDGFAQLGHIFSASNLGAIGAMLLLTFLVAIGAFWLTGRPIGNILVVFPVVFVLTLLALILSGNKVIKETNFETVIFSLALGLLVSNTMKLPAWFKETLSTELFVKIGLVLLGTSVIFGDVLKAGSKGLLQAVVVVISVWYFAYWICKKLKVDDELSMMLSSAVSICGVSAAIATAGAIKGDPKKLSYVVSVVLLTAVPMMIVMPWIANYFHFPEAVTGAWLGGTIDTTGAVVASGSLVGDEALKISTIVKFSQNVLLGIAAFAISVYWTYTKKEGLDPDAKPTLGMIWDRFPKFVVGFIAASLLFSFFLSAETIQDVKGSLKQVQSVWFALAFTSIGLETNFRELLQLNNLKPLYAFLVAQFFNILVTLVIAMILFS